MAKHVCFLVLEHSFLDVRIYKKEAKSLLKKGYKVTMIVPRKKGYLFDVDGTVFRDRFRDDKFIYEGINIVTYEHLYPEKNLKRLSHDLQSNKPSCILDTLTKLGIEQEADIYHAHEFYSLYSGVQIKRYLDSIGKDSKLIYDSHELDPDPLVKAAERTKKLKLEMLHTMLKETDYVLTVSQSIQSWFLNLYPEIPVEVIYNSPPLTPNYNMEKGNNRELVIAFEGVINQKRGSFDKLLKLVGMCNQEFELKVKLIGGRKQTEELLSIPDHLKDYFIHIGWVHYETIPETMKNVDLGWIDIDATRSLNSRFAMPNKFFSYLNNGVPVLVNQCDDMGRFINQYQCGYIVEKMEATAEDYYKALLFLNSNRQQIQNMSICARETMETSFAWEKVEERLYRVYGSL